MIATQASALRVGDRVRDNTNRWDGTVLVSEPSYIVIEYDEGSPPPRSHLHPADMADFTLHRCGVCMKEHSRCDCQPVSTPIHVGDRVVRTDTPCKPGKVLRMNGVEALVIWGMDIGSGDEPQWEPLAELELDITADWYVAEKARQRSAAR